jgi:cell division protein FtsA
MHETLSIIRSRVAQLTSKYDLSLLNAGVVLTGGGALMEGIEELAEEVFKLPTSQGRAEGFQGITRALEQPQYSTVIGLLEYARHNLEPGGGGGFWDYFFGKR